MTEPVEEALLDTDVLSAIMRRHPVALSRARAYLAAQHHFTFSLITRFEILRGLRAKNATTQLVAFERLCAASTILPVTDSVVKRAAMLYADLYRRGALISDADLLIAATALEGGLAVVTNNTGHFERIPDLRLENWLRG